MFVVSATRSAPLIQPSALLGYQASMNPYVGCGTGCTFCYAQQMITEEGHPWGDFVRTRDHIVQRLAGSWLRYGGRSLLIGSMTDPYQALEEQHRLTRTSLQILLDNNPPPELGIFTRSTLVLQDLALLQQFPRVVVHFTMSPYTEKGRQILEPAAEPNTKRFAAIGKLAAAGINVDAQVSPLAPGFSDSSDLVRSLANHLANAPLQRARLDPVQRFSRAHANTLQQLRQYTPERADHYDQIVGDTKALRDWAAAQRQHWTDVWTAKHADSNTRLLWSDHTAYSWVDVISGDVTKLPRSAEKTTPAQRPYVAR